MVAAFAETNRLPFDLPEAESELIAGYHSEYSAMKFSMFFIAEYANMVTASALMATLFFGGWDIPFTLWDNVAPHTLLKTLVTFGCSSALKMLFFVFVFIWIRWTLPRFRYDQLMSLGWKFMLPLALGVHRGRRRRRRSALEYAGIYPRLVAVRASTMLVVNIVLRGRALRRSSTAGGSSARRIRGSTSAISTSCARALRASARSRRTH